ncbi:MAG: aminotransferase class I/II-fold pyridoxal phosphate-dependent enzyme [Planctomycetaceae bacterium]|nr:aminotransferase class I/II-fold pyridoxal phosphate-dependent enzyme [Planctomycetaceae bacterium]
MKDSLSQRGRALVKDMSPLMHADFSTRGDQYHPEKNPRGHINMGTAETHLINDDVIALLRTVQARMPLHAKTLHYDFFHGSVEFRTAIADYWGRLALGKTPKRTLTADNVVVGAGCSLALEMLATMLGDPGDVFLIPAPYYSGFVDDIHDRAGIEPVGVHCAETLDRDALEAAWRDQTAAGKRVKAVLFSSPNNPTGAVYSLEAIRGLIDFCMDKDIDLISDEIYAQTIHDPEARWISTLSLVPDGYETRVHATSSFAKDFALSGFRTGFALSFNQDMVKGMHGLAYYSAVSTHTQALLTELLGAPELPNILKKNRQTLRSAYTLMEECLQKMAVPIMPAKGGIFVFANFSAYMDATGFEAETRLWERIHKELRVNISPGRLFDAPAPGWFRICFAHPPCVVEEACSRLGQLEKQK